MWEHNFRKRDLSRNFSMLMVVCLVRIGFKLTGEAIKSEACICFICICVLSLQTDMMSCIGKTENLNSYVFLYSELILLGTLRNTTTFYENIDECDFKHLNFILTRRIDFKISIVWRSSLMLSISKASVHWLSYNSVYFSASLVGRFMSLKSAMFGLSYVNRCANILLNLLF